MIKVQFNFRPQAENFIRVISQNPNMIYITGPFDNGSGYEVVYRKATPKESNIKRAEIEHLKRLEKRNSKK